MNKPTNIERLVTAFESAATSARWVEDLPGSENIAISAEMVLAAEKLAEGLVNVVAHARFFAAQIAASAPSPLPRR